MKVRDLIKKLMDVDPELVVHCIDQYTDEQQPVTGWEIKDGELYLSSEIEDEDENEETEESDGNTDL